MEMKLIILLHPRPDAAVKLWIDGLGAGKKLDRGIQYQEVFNQVFRIDGNTRFRSNERFRIVENLHFSMILHHRIFTSYEFCDG